MLGGCTGTLRAVKAQRLGFFQCLTHDPPVSAFNGPCNLVHIHQKAPQSSELLRPIGFKRTIASFQRFRVEAGSRAKRLDSAELYCVCKRLAASSLFQRSTGLQIA